MKNTELINKASLFVALLFSALLGVIAADVTVTFIDKSIKVPVKKEKRASLDKVSKEKRAALSDFKDIFTLNVFQAAVKDPDFFEKESGRVVLDDVTREPAAAPAPESSIPEINVDNYELYGTIVSSPKLYSSATIYNKNTRKFEIYGLKEYNRFIDEKYEIIDITRNSIEIKSGDVSVVINIKELTQRTPVERKIPARPGMPARHNMPDDNQQPTDEGITKVAENRYVIDQRLYQSLTKDVSSLMTLQRQISFIPKLDKDRKPMGFEIRRITPGSLFEKIGLRRGDVVKMINGKELKAMSVPEALKLLNDMKDETNINLDYMRNNKDNSIGYEVR